MIEKLYRQLLERRLELERAVFEHPPANWDEFQRRSGAWRELSTLIIQVEETMKGNEDDK